MRLTPVERLSASAWSAAGRTAGAGRQEPVAVVVRTADSLRLIRLIDTAADSVPAEAVELLELARHA